MTRSKRLKNIPPASALIVSWKIDLSRQIDTEFLYFSTEQQNPFKGCPLTLYLINVAPSLFFCCITLTGIPSATSFPGLFPLPSGSKSIKAISPMRGYHFYPHVWYHFSYNLGPLTSLKLVCVCPSKSLEVFGNRRKMFGHPCRTFGQLLKNLRKSSESGRKNSENLCRGKSFYFSFESTLF